MRTISLLSFVLFFVFITHGQTTITGRLVGSDGKPMPKSHVHLVKLGQSKPIVSDKALMLGQLKPIVSVKAARDGTYKISTNQTGPFIIQYTGVHHSQANVLLAVEKPVEEKIAVKLTTHKYSTDFSGVRIISDANNFNFQTAQKMTKLPDGTFTAEFETKPDKFRYQLVRIAGILSINGTQSEDFEYDGTGDYRSVVTPKHRRVQIIFNPKQLVRSDSQAEFRFAKASSSTARAAAVYKAWMQQRAEVPEALAAHLNARKAGEFTYDASEGLKRFSEQYASENDRIVKQVLLLGQIGLANLNRPATPELLEDFLSRAVKEISPASSLWSLNLDAVMSIQAIAEGFRISTKKAQMQSEKKKYQRFAEEFLQKNPDAEGKAILLYGKLMSAKDRNDHQAVTKYYDLLMTKFGDTRIVQLATERLSSNKNVAVGKTVPKFSWVSINDPKTTYTNESFKGKIYLIDFWATWCVPCVEEMEHLHKAYEKLKSKNFEILSVTFDATPEVVLNFRRGKWNMPWLHVILDKESDRLVSKEFEVIGVPKPILVDGNTGKILAVEGELRGQNLEKTLSKFLGEVR